MQKAWCIYGMLKEDSALALAKWDKGADYDEHFLGEVIAETETEARKRAKQQWGRRIWFITDVRTNRLKG